MLTIGEFGRRAELTVKALRLYDGLGLLVPAEVDPYSGRRSYHPDQLERARLVARLRLIGMPLATIRTVADAPAGTAAQLIMAYWRQVEADTAVRARLVADLVEQLSTKGIPMSTKDPQHTFLLAARSGIGAREEQLDRQAHGDGWAAVADGFGDASSATAAMGAVSHRLTGGVDRERVDQAVADAVRAAAALGGESGTTVTMTALIGDELVVAHLGDSRCFLVRDGACEQLTTDHTFVAALVAAGQLSPDEVHGHEHQFLLNRALGPGRADVPDVITRTVTAGDRVVLTTDGVHAVVPAEQFETLVVDPDRERAAESVAAAVRAAGEPDNWTVLVIDVA